MENKSLGQIAYESYSQATFSKHIGGQPSNPTPFDNLPGDLKRAWQTVADTVTEHVKSKAA